MERARRGEGVQFIEVKTYRRAGHAEHDDQRYVPAGELERWARENDPVDRYVLRLLDNEWVTARELEDTDASVREEIAAAVDACVDDPGPLPESALPAVYADPPAAPIHWYRSL